MEDDKLAIEGGTPVRMEFLHFHRPCIEKEEEEEVIDTLRSGWLTTGPKTKAFEQRFVEYTGARHAVGVNSCTAALHIALIAGGVGQEDEVITSPITFAATANVICHVGAVPVFVDVEPETLNIDANLIEEKITPRTRAIIPVHFAGHPCEMDAILEIADKYGLTVIEDAAHAIESVYRGLKIGSISDATAFSFYATKNVTTGEGGMLTLDDDAMAERCRILSLHGISKDAWKRYSEEGYRHWEIIEPGFKYNMFDIQAAIGLHQLGKVDRFWAPRQKWTGMYDEAFADIPEIQVMQRRDYVKTAYHLYVILVRTEMLRKGRDFIMNALQAENIGVGVHFRAVHLHQYYRNTFGFGRGMLPKAEYASDRVVSLPLFPKMTQDDVKDVVAAVKKVIARCQ